LQLHVGPVTSLEGYAATFFTICTGRGLAFCTKRKVAKDRCEVGVSRMPSGTACCCMVCTAASCTGCGCTSCTKSCTMQGGQGALRGGHLRQCAGYLNRAVCWLLSLCSNLRWAAASRHQALC
jgi:hypothetical protein